MHLIALFICKLVDEINKGPNDEVEFQYKVGTDTYESLQDRLQKLHQQGMDEFMKEKIFYIADDYAENLVKQYTNQRREKMIEELNKTIRILKFYSNNDFAFKDVHNEELFYQNGKVLVEVVQLFQEFRIIDSNSLQLLGDLFEQLLNKGFKQNEGQFFTPTPITRFIWKSLPVEKIVFQGDKTTYPKIIDYACGAGHFLTEGFEEINNVIKNKDIEITKDWVEKKLYGVEKDYRLARVSKISLFMHGAGNGNIIFGDGLEGAAQGAATFGIAYVGGKAGLFNKLANFKTPDVFFTAKYGGMNSLRAFVWGSKVLIGETLAKAALVSGTSALARLLIDLIIPDLY